MITLKPTTSSITTVAFDTPDLGDRSYLVSDGAVGVVVDPQRDLSRYLDEARRLGVSITAVLETHIHNDYVSGGLALARATGATYAIPAGEPVSFAGECRALDDGDTVVAGDLMVTAIATAGHTAHHLAYSVSRRDEGDEDGQTVVCTGGSLLVQSTGRTDLLGANLAETLARSQWHSVRRLLTTLPADTRILPTHGFGSFCSAAPAGDSTGTIPTIGDERSRNPAALLDEDAFVKTLLANLPPIPAYYRYMAPLNRIGPAAIHLEPVRELDRDGLDDAIGGAEWVVDLRRRRAFAAEHRRGSLNLELGENLTTYLGWIVPWESEVVLLAEEPAEITEARRLIAHIGRDELAGWAAWTTATGGADHESRSGRDSLASYPVASFSELAEAWPDRAGPGPTVLDVRHPHEWEAGHIRGAHHVPLPDLVGRRSTLPDAPSIWVHCGAGFRAAVAASLLSGWGASPVLVDDMWVNAAEAGLPIVTGDDRIDP